jgi:hypothetical protein
MAGAQIRSQRQSAEIQRPSQLLPSPLLSHTAAPTSHLPPRPRVTITYPLASHSPQSDCAVDWTRRLATWRHITRRRPLPSELETPLSISTLPLPHSLGLGTDPASLRRRCSTLKYRTTHDPRQ